MLTIIRYYRLAFSLLLLLPGFLPQPTAALYKDYREPKNVVLSSLIGGISHIKGAFEVAVILRSRGHNITYITSDYQIKLSKPYGFHTISIGKTTFEPSMARDAVRGLVGDGREGINLTFYAHIKETLLDADYELEYLKYREIFDQIKPDVVVCDVFASACLDASFMAGIPFAILEMAVISSDIVATHRQSHSTSQASVLQLVSLNKKRAKLGVPPVWGMKWDDSVKLVNTFFGFETPRPLGPLVHVIGPVMSDFYSPLTPALTDFLSSHHRIAYEQVSPDSHTLSVLLTALVSSLQAGVIDGVIWAIVQTQSTDFPANISVPNGDSIAVDSLIANAHPDFYFIAWAPQFAILNHTSTRIFISHGGAESSHEALYTGTPLLLQPYFADQPFNTAKLVKAGVALRIDRYRLTVTKVTDSIRCVIEDANGQFAVNVKRMKTLAQIGSRRVVRGADVLEELMFAAVNRTKLTHLYSPAREMTWWKAGNYDLYSVVVVGLISLVYGVGKMVFVVKYVVKSVANRGMVKIKDA